MGNILTPNDLANQQQQVLAQLQAQEQQWALIGLDLAKSLLAVTLKHELEVAEANEQQRREAEYRRLVAEKKAELAGEFAAEEAAAAALLAVPFPPKSAQYSVNVAQALNIANQVAASLLQSRGLPVTPFQPIR